MASEIRVNQIQNRSGLTTTTFTDTGVIISGILTVSDDLNVGGVLTYEDVTNIDSIGIITARSTVSIADSIIHTGDTNTSLRFPAADTITAETGGSERVRIDSNGYLKLSGRNVQGSSNGDKLMRIHQPSRTDAEEDVLLFQFSNTNSSNNITIGGGDSSFNSATDIIFRTSSAINTTSGTDRLLIDSTGRVGITSIIPASKFTVKGGSIFVGDSNMHGGSAGVIEYGGNSGHFDLKSYSMGGQTTIRMFTSSGGTNSERLRITNTGQLLLGSGAIATPKVTQTGSLDLDSGGISLCIGGNENSNGRTNSTNKLNRVVTPHYTNAEEPMAMISGYSTSSAGQLFYGGGSGLTNAVTTHHFYTAANHSTTTGTERIRLVSNGQMIVGEANTSPVSDLEVRRANAGGDVAIRIGNNSNQDSGTTASLYFTTSPTQDFNTFYIQAARSDGSTRFGYGSSENMRLSSDGNLSIRTTGTPNFDRSADYGLYIAGSTYSKAGMAIRVDANDDNPCSIVLAKSRSSGDTIVGNNDDIGQLDFMANDGNGFHTIARVAASMDGENSTVGNNDMPGNLRFFTCEDGGTSLTERARIHSWGGLELSNCKLDYGSNDPSHSYFYTFHKSGTYNTFSVDIGFRNPGGYNLELMMGGYNNRKMHTVWNGYVYNGSHYGGVGAIDSGNGPQRSFNNVSTYGSYGTKMRFQFTSMSSTHTVVTMRLSYGPAGGTGRASRAEITDCSWS